MKRAELLSTSQVHDGRRVDLRLERIRLPNGAETTLEVVRHTGAAAVVPLTAEERVLMIRQYRHATGGWLLELPAGTLEGGVEDPEACARRELIEETGHRAGSLEPLGWIWTSPGFTDEKIWLYLARELEPDRQRLEPDELLTLEEVPLVEAAAAARAGEITDAKTICGLLRAVSLLESGR